MPTVQIFASPVIRSRDFSTDIFEKRLNKTDAGGISSCELSHFAKTDAPQAREQTVYP